MVTVYGRRKVCIAYYESVLGKLLYLDGRGVGGGGEGEGRTKEQSNSVHNIRWSLGRVKRFVLLMIVCMD